MRCLNCEDVGQVENHGARDTVYLGHTGHTHHKRQREHQEAMGRPSGIMSSSVAKHHAKYHGDQEPKFSSKIVESHTKNLYRKVAEALAIERKSIYGARLMNQKSERGKLRLPRMVIGLDEGQGQSM